MTVVRPGVRWFAALTSSVLLTACDSGASSSVVHGGSVATESATATVPVGAATSVDPSSTSRPSTSARIQGHRTPMQHRLHGMTLRNKVEELLVLSFSGTTAPRSLIRRWHPGGLIYFSDNLLAQHQTRALSARSQRLSRRVGQPLLIMTDQEGGIVTRVPGTSGTPGGADFAGSSSAARRTAERTGTLLHRLGINVDLAPDADVNTVGSAGVIGPRSFSSSPDVVSRLVRAQICGYHRGGVAATAKHFPGHGSTSTDSHKSTATITESRRTWRAVDLPPFRQAVRSSVDLVMVGHLAFPAMSGDRRPASISGGLTHRLLRRRLGFDGVVITDALNMGGITSSGRPALIAVHAVRAGADLLLMTPQPAQAVSGLMRAVHSGRLSVGRINAAVGRILALKRRLGLLGADAALPTC